MRHERIVPSTIPSIYSLEEQIKEKGLTEDDFVVLLQKRIKGRPPKRDIRATLKALKEIERQLRGANDH